MIESFVESAERVPSSIDGGVACFYHHPPPRRVRLQPNGKPNIKINCHCKIVVVLFTCSVRERQSHDESNTE